MDFESMTDYELCALYCDYAEWLESPATGPSDEGVRWKYMGKLNDIVLTIAQRYKEEVS